MLPIYLLEFIHRLPGIEAGFMEGIRSISQVMAPVALTALWQGAVIAIGLAITLRIAPWVPASHRFLIWAGSFLLLLVLPVLPSFAHVLATPAPSISIGSSSSSHWLQLNMRWAVAITGIWLVASSLRAGDLLIHFVRLFRLWKKATPVHGSASSVSILTVRGRRNFELCTTSELDRPSVIGFFAPRILIPDWLLDRLTPAELDQVVLHEAEHLHRHDDWTNLFQKLCLIAFPLNAALAWIEHRLCREREMACDEAVIRATKAPRAYAACLTSLAERGLRRRAEALSLGAWQRRAELVNRVHSILSRPRKLSPLATRAVLGTLSCGLIVGAVELSRCPQFVAFTADSSQPLAAKTIQQIGNSDQANDSSYAVASSPDFTGRFRAVNTMARSQQPSPMPALKQVVRPERVPVHSAAAVPVIAKTQERASDLVSAAVRQKQSKADGSSPQPEEWLVLTTWEQVESSTPSVVSDTDTMAANTAPKSEQKTPSRVGVTSQVTVTRLILRVSPANSAPSQPSAIPLVRDGWFVFQL